MSNFNERIDKIEKAFVSKFRPVTEEDKDLAWRYLESENKNNDFSAEELKKAEDALDRWVNSIPEDERLKVFYNFFLKKLNEEEKNE